LQLGPTQNIPKLWQAWSDWEGRTGYSFYTCKLQLLRRSLDQRKACVVTLLNYKKDGEKFWNRLSIYPIEVKDKKYFVGIQNDITSMVQTSGYFETLKRASNIDGDRIHGLMNLL
jgi:hypothetical protein